MVDDDENETTYAHLQQASADQKHDPMDTQVCGGASGLGVQTSHDILVAQCSATPATVPATPPCSATPFQTQISVRHLPGMGGGERCNTKMFRGCGATPLLHLQNAIKSGKSAATRVARQVSRDRGYQQSCATKHDIGVH